MEKGAIKLEQKPIDLLKDKHLVFITTLMKDGAP